MKKFISICFIITLTLLIGCMSQDMTDPKTSAETYNKNFVVLFEGITIDEKDRETDISSITENELDALKQKYNVKYKAYGNNAYLGEFEGNVEQRGLDWYWQVSFSEEMGGATVLISDTFNPYPRVSRTANENEYDKENDVVEQINSRFGVSASIVELIKVDLDDDGNDEKVIYCIDNSSYSYYVCLADKDGKLISYLMALTNAEKELDYKLNENVNIIDFDNDNNMEIAVKLPAYEGLKFNVYEYENGNFNGDFINECSIQP